MSNKPFFLKGKLRVYRLVVIFVFFVFITGALCSCSTSTSSKKSAQKKPSSGVVEFGKYDYGDIKLKEDAEGSLVYITLKTHSMPAKPLMPAFFRIESDNDKGHCLYYRLGYIPNMDWQQVFNDVGVGTVSTFRGNTFEIDLIFKINDPVSTDFRLIYDDTKVNKEYDISQAALVK